MCLEKIIPLNGGILVNWLEPHWTLKSYDIFSPSVSTRLHSEARLMDIYSQCVLTCSLNALSKLTHDNVQN